MSYCMRKLGRRSTRRGARRVRAGGASGRAGQAAGPAVSYGGAGLVLAWLGAVLIYAGAAIGDPRRVTLGVMSAVAATGLLIYAGFLGSRALAESRACRECNRPGEKIIGLFGGGLMRREDGGRVVSVQPVMVIVTNQRLVLHPRPRGREAPGECELEMVRSVTEFGPVAGPPIQQCVLVGIELADGRQLLLRMGLSTAHEFRQVQASHLMRSPRRVRAVVMQASGPTPAKPDEALAEILDDGKPVLYQFVLAENFLRIIGDRPQLMADLWWYFHWEHMQVSPVETAEVQGIPAGWRCLRLTFHAESSMVVCGPAENIERLREKAIGGGAQTAANEGEQRPTTGNGCGRRLGEARG
jgi:hypothetical protein